MDLKELCEQKELALKSTFLKRDEKGASHWEVIVYYRILPSKDVNAITTSYHMGSAHKDEPRIADVVHSLISDAQCAADSFEGFCSEFGYDADSIKALGIYKACKKNAIKIARLLGEDLKEFEQAAQDY